MLNQEFLQIRSSPKFVGVETRNPGVDTRDPGVETRDPVGVETRDPVSN